MAASDETGSTLAVSDFALAEAAFAAVAFTGSAAAGVFSDEAGFADFPFGAFASVG
ncbi:hypothetical protein [Methylobacterium sp. Leaf125]|uniref:hypothetical protein n=1 Tax=Methylobacterium sp. Leaf125 TaxID=1736265 RepID=UPI0012E10252|nr:hypothetical protein [Methylobacterium sp. Leaf125]